MNQRQIKRNELICWHLVLVVTTVLYVVASAVRTSDEESTAEVDVMDGVVMLSLTIFWCLLGLYAKNLAYRLYSSLKFLHMVRLHAKTILKVNAAFVFFLLLSSFVAVNNIQAYRVWYADQSTCTKGNTR